MLKLYGININGDEWNVKKIENDNYYKFDIYEIEDKKTGYKYTFDNVLGINEVGDHDFLVYQELPRKLSRIKLKESRKNVLFKENIQDYIILDDDRILFTYIDDISTIRGKYIYSISKNDMLEEFNWLSNKILTVYENDNSKKTIYIEDILDNTNKNYFLSFAVDSDTFEPISDCYSYLRDKFIKIDCKEDYLELVKEENKYLHIIENMQMKDKISSIKNVKEKVLK